MTDRPALSADRGQPRIQYPRTYVLLPPEAGPDWVHAVTDATWSQHRYTIGGSADDAGIGDLDHRHVIAINPARWLTDLPTFFQEYYLNVILEIITADTPEMLYHILSGEMPLAFTGAQGAGQYTVGGRGGEVLEVTNLKDDGDGSLRWALSMEYPRVVNVMVSGNVRLERPLTVRHPFLTLNGNAGPGMGICTYGAPVRIQTHQIIWRYARSRPGKGDWPAEDLDALDLASNVTDDPNRRVRDVIIDHCSFSWSGDENLALWNTTPNHWMENITVQWCIISEGLEPHGMGLLIGANEHRHSIRNVSVHHNLFAHNSRRNPRLAAVSPVEVVNNVIFDCPGYATLIKHVPTHLNYTGNTQLGPGQDHMLLVEPHLGPNAPVEDYLAHRIYTHDNAGRHGPDWRIVGKGWGERQPADGEYQAAWQAPTPTHIPNSSLVAEDGAAALAAVLQSAGCLPHCPVDARVAQDVTTGRTGLIASQEEVGGWPNLE